MERVDRIGQDAPSRLAGRVVVGLHGTEVEDYADVLVAADYAASSGARRVVVAADSRWPRLLAALSCLSCATGYAYTPTGEVLVREEVRQRLASMMGLVGVEWELRWTSGSCTRALLRYVRRSPADLVVFGRPHGTDGPRTGAAEAHE